MARLAGHVGDGAVGGFGDLGQGGVVEAVAEAVEVAEAHDEGTPAVGVDAVGVVREKDAVVDVGADDADFEG